MHVNEEASVRAIKILIWQHVTIILRDKEICIVALARIW
jgi:hypothetical protein